MMDGDLRLMITKSSKAVALLGTLLSQKDIFLITVSHQSYEVVLVVLARQLAERGWYNA